MGVRRGPAVLRAVLCAGLGVAPWASGCGSPVELVVEAPEGVDRRAPAVRVPYPPPPAQVEMLPLRRRDECAWRDGYWQWAGVSWAWTAGAWVVPAEDCEYVRPETRWMKDNGSMHLVFHPPEWRSTEPNASCAEPKACASLLPESKAETGGLSR